MPMQDPDKLQQYSINLTRRQLAALERAAKKEGRTKVVTVRYVLDLWLRKRGYFDESEEGNAL